MNIRKVEESDVEKIFNLTKQFATSFKTDYKLFKISFNALLEEPSACFLLAEENHNISAYCLGFDHYTLYANGRVSWVEEIFVLEEYRRKGIARILMANFENWARSRNSKLIGLATRRAKDFYSSLGYEDSAIFFRKLL
jgi:GNAT superfamily N-acetyltransferase